MKAIEQLAPALHHSPRPAHAPAGATPPAPYRRVFRALDGLTAHQRLVTCCYLSELVNGKGVCALIDRITRENLRCPHCEGASLYRHGVANGLQRYRCRSCRRTFNGLTGTPLARLRLKDRWLAYFDCLRDPACTVRSAADQVKVHANTSFRWRHRFLAWTKFDRPRALNGIAESAGIFLKESQKGAKQLARKPRRHGGGCLPAKHGASKDLVNVVMARDRAGNTIDFVAGRGALTADALHANLLSKLATDVMLVSEAGMAYTGFAAQAHIEHMSCRAPNRAPTRGAIHLENVHAYHSRFQHWLRHFRGVATRYLENYLGWQWAIDGQRIDTAARFLRAALGKFNSKR